MGFFPIRAPGSKPSSKAKGGDDEGFGPQLVRFFVWQFAVYLAGLLVLMAVTVTTSVTGYETVTGLRGYTMVSGGTDGWITA